MTTPKPFDDSPYFFLIDKPAGMTSFDVIRELKPHLYARLGKGKGRNKLKVGHFGTLDPFATGLLLVGTGKSLKLTDYIHRDFAKSYEATGVIGQRTLTGDCDGDIVETLSEVAPIDELLRVISEFPQEYLQRPSYFSAVKHEGKHLYEYAREGIFIDKEPVLRKIKGLKSKHIDQEYCEFSCQVSTGTYIRALWEDICSQAKTIGHLKSLRRTHIGHLSVENALALSSPDLGQVKALMPDEVIKLAKIQLEESQYNAIGYGADISVPDFNEELCWCSYEGKVVALLKKVGHGSYRAAVNFIARS